MRLFRLLLISMLALATLGASECSPTSDGTCRACGFEPNSQQFTTYTNTDGATVNIVFWADAQGCVTIYGCQGP